MRHLIDTYNRAGGEKNIALRRYAVIGAVVKTAIAEAINLMPDAIKSSPEAIA